MVDYRKCPECGAYVEGPADMVCCDLCGKVCCYNCICGAGVDLCPACEKGRSEEEDADE